MRELTQQEQDFIKESVATSSKQESKSSNKKTVSKRSKDSVTREVRFWANPVFWMSIVMIIPALVTGAVAYLDYKARTYLGDSIEWLTQQKLSDDFVQLTQKAGMGWLPKFIEYYPYRWTVVVSVWVVSVLIILIIMFIDYKRHKNEE